MNYDYVTLYNKNAEFYRSHPTALRAVRLGNIVLSWLFVACYGILWVYALIIDEFSTSELLSILFPPAVTLLAASFLRKLIERPRPYTEKGAQITPLVTKKHAENNSFPSRHLACAAAIAVVYLPFYPVAGGFLIVCSLLLGYVRFALGLHYPSDLLAGEGLGIALGALAFIF